MAGQELPPTPAGLVIGQEQVRGSYGTVHSGELDGSPVVGIGHISGVEKQLAISNMAEGLKFLHERAEPIIHRDLKPQNVHVCEDGAVKIGDFGQSKLLGQPQSYMKTTQPGTVVYMPPEALSGECVM